MTRTKKKMNLSEYVHKRNGVSLGSSGSMNNMLDRSFGAKSFRGFWRYWNPIFGYYLNRFIYSPLLRIVPDHVALVLTFLVCGLIHDIVTMAVRGSFAFFFVPWFLLLGLAVVFDEKCNLNQTNRSKLFRVLVNVFYLGICLIGALIMQKLLNLH